MTDDLGRRFEQLSQRVPDGAPDVAEAFEGGRRMVRRRALASTAGIVALISLVTFGALNLDLSEPAPGPNPPATHDDGVFVPAEPGEPTYTLTNFRIESPWAEVDAMPGMAPGSEERERYCSMPGRAEKCEAEGNVGFFYDWEWSTDSFPGNVACLVVLYADDGEEVGRASWELTGMEPRSRQPGHVLVHVSGKPDRAEAACEAGTLESGPTHRFTFVRAESYLAQNPRPGTESTYRNRLLFEVETLTEHSSGMCRVEIHYESGEIVSSTFTLTGAPPEHKLYELGAPYRDEDPVVDASVTCETFTGREAQDAGAAFVPYPGVQWYGPDGDEIPLRAEIINAITGPDHCGWESGVMMHVGWPLGHAAKDASESRQYFRDPEGVFPQDMLMTTYDGDVALPDGATNTGYHTDFMQLWLDQDDKRAAYLVFDDHVERWPRGRETIACD